MDAIQKRPVIAMTLCESSRIAAHGHDAATNTLALQFKKKGDDGEMVPGAVYHYAGFPAERYEQLKSAESIGRYFGQVVSAKDEDGNLVYPYTRIDEPEAE